MERSQYPVAKKKLKDPDPEYVEGTPGERIAMVWEITKDAWAFVEGFDAEQRLQRHIEVLKRRER